MGTERGEKVTYGEILRRYMTRFGIYIYHKGKIIILFLLSFKRPEQEQDDVTDCKVYITVLITKSR